MSTRFFNNSNGRTLFDKLKGIANGMSNFDKFLAVAGFFRSSGYFKLREELKDVKEIKILVGINIDDIFRSHSPAMLMIDPSVESEAKEEYFKDFEEDIRQAKYSPEVERGILQMCQDLIDGKLEMRIHHTKNLHAKFYLCLPENHNEDTDGWVIMGSSNISESGLGITRSERYELNVAMKDYDDVKYCHDEFNRLWEEAIPLTTDDINRQKRNTYLGYQPTPYEIYIKVLIDSFGDQVEDDFTIQLPDNVLDLKYQRDAVIQGYQMLKEHNGLFLADVVGLGKTMIATMIAKRFVEANGKNTNILVIYPPALEHNWKKTFKQFGISNKAQFITNGSLSQVINGENQYKSKEEFHLIIVDEAHGFRSDSSEKYNNLQKICKSSCSVAGMLGYIHKKVMLLSATPLNNKPEDLLNLLLLFQNSQQCTIDGIPNLKAFFSPLVSEFKTIMREREKRDVTPEVDRIYQKIREKVMDKVTIRRTRHNIMNDDDYKKDLEAQHIKFPHINPPVELEYQLDEDTSERFYKTLGVLTNSEKSETHLEYARYRAIEFLTDELKGQYGNAEQVSTVLANIYRVHMVKRLESSFYAFKKSLKTLLRITNDMINMWNEDKIIIAPDLNVKDMLAKGMELDAIIEHASEKGFAPDDIVRHRQDFKPEFIELLKNDKKALEQLCEDWEKEHDDPKFDLFLQKLVTEFKDPKKNVSGKIVVFSESVDTLTYLNERLAELGVKDAIMVSASSRAQKVDLIRANFDANHPKEEQRDQYNILLTSDVLAEGINLHRANFIINYDSPWNATRLMQRIGRVNRIGSKASEIYNYTFYPSRQGDKEIQLYKNALIKLQGFHSAFGEDAQIYSREEIVKQFEMFDSNVRDIVDRKIELLRELRQLYNTNPELYHKIKQLPMKSRVMRDTGKHQKQSIVFVASPLKHEFYHVSKTQISPLDFIEAVDYLKAPIDEQPAPFNDNEDLHYEHVNKALTEYRKDFAQRTDTAVSATRTDLDRTSLQALKFIRTLQQVTDDNSLKESCKILKQYIEDGVYAQLPRSVRDIAQKYRGDDALKDIKNNQYKLSIQFEGLVNEYRTQTTDIEQRQIAFENPDIVISETFI